MNNMEDFNQNKNTQESNNQEIGNQEIDNQEIKNQEIDKQEIKNQEIGNQKSNIFDIIQEPKNNESSFKSRTSIVFIVILVIYSVLMVLLSGFIGYKLAFRNNNLITDKEYEIFKKYDITMFDKFDLLMKSIAMIDSHYYETVSYDELDKIVSMAVMNGLDDFSSARSYSDLTSEATTSIGLGIKVSFNLYNEAIINYVYPTSDAYSKLQRGDILKSINNIRVINTPSLYISALLSLIPNGDSATITVIRNGSEIAVEVKKDSYINTQAYYIGDLGGGIDPKLGYINLASFTGTAVSDFDAAVKSFKADNKEGLILDLRGNGGGSGVILEKIAEYLIYDKNSPNKKSLPIIEFVDSKAGVTTVYSTHSTQNYINVPIYVLADSNTASSSEALIGAMLYYETGVLIGDTTYGKGVGQTTFLDPMIDNDGEKFAVSLTTGYYYVYTKDLVKYPTGKMSIHGVGFTPQYPVTSSAITSKYSDDLAIMQANQLFGTR